MLRRILLLLLCLTLLAACLWAPARTAVWNNPALSALDERAEAYVDSALSRALVTYALVRTVNGLVSVLQESEVALSPAGVGVTLAAGQVLDPLNDLIERFSWVLLAAATSLGVQKMLLHMADWAVAVLLAPLGLGLLAAACLRRRVLGFDLAGAGARLVVAAVVLRLAVPCAALVNQALDERFLQPVYAASSGEVERLESGLSAQVGDAPGLAEDGGGGWFSALDDALDLRRKLAGLKVLAQDAVQAVAELLVVFVLGTVLLPIALLWGLVKLAGWLLSSPVPEALRAAWTGRIRPRP